MGECPIDPGSVRCFTQHESLLGISQYRLAKDINVDPRRINGVIMPSLAAIFHVHEGRPEPAAELLGLALSQPLKATVWMAEWVLLNHVRAELQADLGQSAFEAAFERGKSLDLKAASEQVLREIVSPTA